MMCGVTPNSIPKGRCGDNVGVQPEGCIWEYAWNVDALADAASDATLKYVPRNDDQYVVGFLVDHINCTVASVTANKGAGLLTALTKTGTSVLPKQSSSVGAALANSYSLDSFLRSVVGNDPIKALQLGLSPWGQFGIASTRLTKADDVTATIKNISGGAADFAGVYQVLQA